MLADGRARGARLRFAAMKTILRSLPFVTITLMAAALITACGDETSSTSDVESTCCFNGAFFECSDADNQNCTDPTNDCDRDPSRDDEC